MEQVILYLQFYICKFCYAAMSVIVNQLEYSATLICTSDLDINSTVYRFVLNKLISYVNFNIYLAFLMLISMEQSTLKGLSLYVLFIMMNLYLEDFQT